MNEVITSNRNSVTISFLVRFFPMAPPTQFHHYGNNGTHIWSLENASKLREQENQNHGRAVSFLCLGADPK